VGSATRDGKSKSEKLESKLYRMANSAMCFSIAYMLILYGYYFATAIMAKVFGLDPTVYYYGIKILLNKHHWSKFNVFFIYSFGTLYLALISMLCAVLFFKFKENLRTINLVFLWGSIIGFSMFCGQFVIAALGAQEYNSPFFQNLTVAFAWIYLPLPLIYILTIPAGALLCFLATKASKPLLTLAYSFSKVNKPMRKRKYFLETVIGPFLIGGLAVFLFTFPLNIYLNLVYLLMIAIAIVVAFVIIPFQELQIDEVLRYKKLQDINISIVLVLGFLIAIFTLTWKGIILAF
jgi:hypothetical protein